MTALFAGERQYTPVDEMDEAACRPNFCVLVYPAYLVPVGGDTLREEIRVKDNVPPMFLTHAFDDPVTPLSSILLAAELKRAGIPTELHLYARGGHGYGLRATEMRATSWPSRCAEWMRSQKLLSTVD